MFHERPSAGLGAAFLILAAGQALGTPLAGVLGDAIGLGTTFGLFAAVAVATAFVRPEAADDRADPTSAGA